MQRRRFLGRLAGATALYSCQSLGLAGCASSPVAPSPVAAGGSGTANVRAFGAIGNGIADDTAAFAAAVEAATRLDGTIEVPDGIYLINPRTPVTLRSDTALRLAAGAVLQAIPVSQPDSAVVLVRDAVNVVVTGGTIVGERHQHTGTTGEWGMGIDVRGSAKVEIIGVTVRDCWGDGIYIGAGRSGESRDVTIRNVRCLGNRRQGLSMTACLSAVVLDSEFRDTAGIAPQSGIDLEPNAPYAVQDVTIRNCVASGNAGCGILLVGERVSNVTIERNQCIGNEHFAGIGMLRVTDCTVRDNLVEWNRWTGVHLERSTGTTLAGNRIRHNGQARTRQWPNLMLVGRASSNTVSGNQFADPQQSPAVQPGFDVTVDADCDANRITGNTVRPRDVDAQGRVTGGIRNNSASTVLADNA